MKYSVLMSVYAKEKPNYLIESIESIVNQTILTDDFVIVCDGPLPNELELIIEEYSKKYNYINILKLPKNIGLGLALNFGLDYCKNNLVARMDSDDISLPQRCEYQLSEFIKNPNLSITSSSVLEFFNNDRANTILKSVPISHDEILNYSKKRNPFNHPSVMFKKEDVIAVGGYQHFMLYEDYFLWIRLLNSGKITRNIAEPLLLMRTSYDLYKRRGGYKYFKTGVKFQKYLLQIGYINIATFTFNILMRLLVQVILPNKIRTIYYKTLLRKVQYKHQ